MEDCRKQPTIRPARLEDVDEMHRLRLSVRENALADPDAVTPAAYVERLTGGRGLGWVSEINGEIVGFAVVDLAERNLWALFVRPDEEGNGIGSALHDLVIAASSSLGVTHLWLTTGRDTRAEGFYLRRSWQSDSPAPGPDIRLVRATR